MVFLMVRFNSIYVHLGLSNNGLCPKVATYIAGENMCRTTNIHKSYSYGFCVGEMMSNIDKQWGVRGFEANHDKVCCVMFAPE